jgi:hypothetical protein
MNRDQKDYRRMLAALLDARIIVASLLRQLNLEKAVTKEQLHTLTRQCALDVVQKELRPLGRKPRRQHRRRVKR